MYHVCLQCFILAYFFSWDLRACSESSDMPSALGTIYGKLIKLKQRTDNWVTDFPVPPFERFAVIRNKYMRSRKSTASTKLVSDGKSNSPAVAACMAGNIITRCQVSRWRYQPGGKHVEGAPLILPWRLSSLRR